MAESFSNKASSSVMDHIFCLKTRQAKDCQFSRPHRWTVYLIGVLETFIFSGCIFGWGPLVYVLKNEDIFLNLCYVSEDFNATQVSIFNETQIKERNHFVGCEAQNEEFALIYTIAMLAYSVPSVLCGMILHYWGLVLSRLTGSLLVTLGLLALGSTTRDESRWLYVAMIFMSLGASQLRFSALQFCNLFPKYRSTALTVISGSYAASAGLFILFQIGQQNGLSLWMMSHFLTAFGIFSFVVTVIMPWHHVPYEKASSQMQKRDVPPLTQSIFSLSNFLHIFYIMFNASGLIFYSVNFNSWISSVSDTNEDAGHYTLIYSICSFACLFVTPLPGMLYDFLVRRSSKVSDLEERLLRELKCPTLPLMIVILLNVSLQICFFFRSSTAVYISLIILMLLRPSVLSAGTAALRIRFPAEHFDRLVGICSTTVACVFALQYPFFILVQNYFVLAMSGFITLLLLTSSYPLHFLLKNYRLKIVKGKLATSSKARNLMLNDNN